MTAADLAPPPSLPDGARIPDCMSLDVDEDDTIALVCDHPAHQDRPLPVATYGWWQSCPDRDVPHFGTQKLAEFIASAHEHAWSHMDYPDVPDWRDIRTGTYKAWKEFADRKGIRYHPEATRTRIACNVRQWIRGRQR